MEVDFDLKDPHDPVDDEMFPRDIFEAQGFEGSDAGASEESFFSEESFTYMQEEEGADSDIELLEEPPLGAKFRY